MIAGRALIPGLREEQERHGGWRAVALPGRGTTYACDLAGPSHHAPTVVLLHGLTATGALNWGASLHALNRHFRVVALDHRGHGRGIDDGRPFTLEDCADDAIALADVLGVGQAIFAGYSMGGPIAQLVWRRHPQRVSGLILCATAADFLMGPDRRAVIRTLEGVHRTSRLIPRPLREHGARALVNGLLIDPALKPSLVDALARHDVVAVREAGRAVRSYCSTDWITEVSVPTVVVVTERDRLVPAVRQHELARLIPDATVIGVDGNHLAFLNQPEVLTEALVDACLRVAAEAAAGGRPRGRLARLVARLRPRRRRPGR